MLLRLNCIATVIIFFFCIDLYRSFTSGLAAAAKLIDNLAGLASRRENSHLLFRLPVSRNSYVSFREIPLVLGAVKALGAEHDRWTRLRSFYQ